MNRPNACIYNAFLLSMSQSLATHKHGGCVGSIYSVPDALQTFIQEEITEDIIKILFI